MCLQRSGIQVLNKNNVPPINTIRQAFRHEDFHNSVSFPQFPQFHRNCGNCGKYWGFHNYIKGVAQSHTLLMFKLWREHAPKKNTVAPPCTGCGTFSPSGFGTFGPFPQFPQFPQFRSVGGRNCGNCETDLKLWNLAGRRSRGRCRATQQCFSLERWLSIAWTAVARAMVPAV